MSESAPRQSDETSRMELYIWPHSWNLPSFDIDCLATTLYLQLAIHRHKNTKQLPHHYTLVECTDPDLSPSGTLPFLVHGSEKIGTFTGIVRYLKSLGLELDEQDETDAKNGEEHIGQREGAIKRAKRVAWISLVDSQLRDLVNHTLYAQPENYREGIHTALVNILPIPSRYYLPARLRSTVQTSLEPAGLWTMRDEEAMKKKHPFEKEKDRVVEEKDSIIREAFGKEKLLHKARDTFDLLTPLLKQSHSHPHHHHRGYFLSNHPTSLDTLLASHILLLKHAPLPNNHLLPLLKESYPMLLEHAERILALAFPTNAGDTFRGDVEVTQAPHANPIIQLGRALGRTLQAVLPAGCLTSGGEYVIVRSLLSHT